jgi:DNA-directed RNA polymerase III subunit RPC3
MDEKVWEAARGQSPKLYLYTSIARGHLGEVAAIVVSILISCGRLSVKDISHRTKLGINVVKSGLVSLTQLNCIDYWKDESTKQVLYSFNEEGLEVWIHSGDIIHYIRTKYGEEYAEIIQIVLSNGHIKISDYLNNLELEEIKLAKQSLLFKLFSDKWLKRLQPINFNSINDVWSQVYKEVLRNFPRNSTTSEVKRVAEATERAKVKYQELMEAGQTPKDLYITQDGLKLLQPNLVIIFNLSRFKKHLRTVALTNLARSRIGNITSKVYEIALEMIESKSPELSHDFLKISGLINDPQEEREFITSIENRLVDEKAVVFNVRELLKSLPDTIDLRNSILTHNFLKPNQKRTLTGGEPNPKKQKIKTESEDLNAFFNEADANDELDRNGNGATDNSDPHSISLLQHHLKLLSSGSNVQFLTEVTPGSYTVPFKLLVDQLKQSYFETIVKSTLGPQAFRVLRCIKSQKVGDEKSVANAVLLKEKSVRNEIYKLVKLNFLEIQEVPRSADRAASKTFYLFRHKERSAYDFLAASIVFSMAEILTNIQIFKNDHKILLAKCEREDVKGREDELLLDSEVKTLKGLQSREINNIGRFNRLKSIYDVFSL